MLLTDSDSFPKLSQQPPLLPHTGTKVPEDPVISCCAVRALRRGGVSSCFPSLIPSVWLLSLCVHPLHSSCNLSEEGKQHACPWKATEPPPPPHLPGLAVCRFGFYQQTSWVVCSCTSITSSLRDTTTGILPSVGTMHTQ